MAILLPENDRREPDAPWFQISLAQWSFHRRLRDEQAPVLFHLDFAAEARRLDIGAVEYCSIFFADKVHDGSYLNEMERRAADQGVRSLLIMVDRAGDLGDPDKRRRAEAVTEHRKWLEAASRLGCHSIRVNAKSAGPDNEQARLVADGLASLSGHAAEGNLNVLVENHGGLSSRPDWLMGVIESVDMDNCGTLPDFGNFRDEDVDRYEAVKAMMPRARAVSAKSNHFDAKGNERDIDYHRMLEIVREAGYRGHIGIEYEGPDLPEIEGVLRTKDLLIRVRGSLPV